MEEKKKRHVQQYKSKTFIRSRHKISVNCYKKYVLYKFLLSISANALSWTSTRVCSQVLACGPHFWWHCFRAQMKIGPLNQAAEVRACNVGTQMKNCSGS